MTRECQVRICEGLGVKFQSLLGIFVGGNQGSPSISVRSTSNSDRKFKALASDAKCQEATYAPQ